MTLPLCDLPGHELADRLRRKEISAVEILEAVRQRIQAVEGRAPSTEPYQAQTEDLEKVPAFITLTYDRARKQAEAIDRAGAAGEDPGPLAGVPLAVKDIFCVRGPRSTAASRILEDFISPYSATSDRKST